MPDIGSKVCSQRLVLASASPRRLDLLKQINVTPSDVIPADIDEDALVKELPKNLALRLAVEKCEAVRLNQDGCFVLAADTVVSVGRRSLPKAETLEVAKSCLELLSGKSHRVYTGVCLICPEGKMSSKVVESRVTFKRLSSAEMNVYLDKEEWRGKAGGYAIQGAAGAFIPKIQGSYSAIVGLPLYEVRQMLVGLGYQMFGSGLEGE